MATAADLKGSANELFKKKKYIEALVKYTQAIEANEKASAPDKELQTVLFSNRAAARMNLESPQFEEALKDAESAIRLNPGFIKALYRSGQAHEGIAKASVIPSERMKGYEQAMIQFAKVMRLDSGNKAAINGAKRVRVLIEMTKEQLKSPDFYVKRLKELSSPSTVSKDIKIVMHMFIHEDGAKKKILALGFPSLLMHIARTGTKNNLPKDTYAVALRALGTLIIRTSQHLKKLGDGDKSDSDLTKDDITKLSEASKWIFGQFHGYQKSFAEMDQEAHREFQFFVHFMARFVTHNELEKHRKLTMMCWVELMALCDKELEKLAEGQGDKKEGDKNEGKKQRIIETLASVLKGIAIVGDHDIAGRSLAREYVLPALLFSGVASQAGDNPKLRECLVATLSVVLEKKPDVGVNNDKYEKMNKESEEKTKEAEAQFKQQITTLIVTPLMSQHEPTQKKGLRALALVLQAIPKIGIHIINAKFKLTNEKGGKVDAPNTRPKEEKEEKKEEAKDEKDKGDDTHNPEEPEPKKKEEEEGTSALDFLLFMAIDGGRVQEMAAEVLALASSDKVIRETIVASGDVDIFIGLLKSKDHLVRAQAGVALAKIAAVGDQKHTEDKLELMLGSMCECLEEFSKDNTSDKKSEVKDAAEDDYARIIANFEANMSAKNLECARHIIESIAYMSVNVMNKKMLVSKDGKWLKNALSFADSDDNAIRFGILSLIHNMTVSEDDIKKDYNEEIEQLRRVAQKGLPGAGKDEMLTQKAGSSKQIAVIRELMVKYGVTTALVKSYKMYIEKHKAALEITEGTASEELKAQLPKVAIPEHLLQGLGATLMNLATQTRNRGLMVQQGALGLCLNLLAFKEEKSTETATMAMARIAISTNPHVLPSESMLFSMVKAFLKVMDATKFELHQFEAIMALTNLASVSDDLRHKIIMEGGWSELQGCLAETNERVQRAALECLTNLVTCPKAIERLLGEKGTQDIRLFLMFVGSDDHATSCAAAGALAMISDMPELAKKIAATELTSTFNGDEGDEGEEQEITRSGLITFHAIMRMPDLHPDLRARAEYCLTNMIEALEKLQGNKS